MNSQKLENQLKLSLDSTMEEREKSQVLNVGFDREERTWELIVKFNGDIGRLADERISVEVLLAGYAIITLPESLIPALADLEEIEYVEKPRELLYGVYAAKEQACFPDAGEYGAVGRAARSRGMGELMGGVEGLAGGMEDVTGGTEGLTGGTEGLTGQGCLVAVFDSGIDYRLEDFQNQYGSRILYLWDQTLQPDEERGFRPPEGFSLGVEFTREQINEALTAGEEGLRLVPSVDASGHGTAVAAIAAGSSPDPRYAGAAPGAGLLIVKLGQAGRGSFPRTTQLMRAMTYALRKAQQLGMPLAVNISFGNSYGPHEPYN